jgi:hypothetical protein
VRCAAITSGGSRCKLEATTASNYCWSHAPETAAARKQRARKGGKARGTGELSEIKRSIREAIDEVREGAVERGIGAVLFQGYNTLLKAVEVGRKLREQEELEERLQALEAMQEGQKGGKRWRA